MRAFAKVLVFLATVTAILTVVGFVQKNADLLIYTVPATVSLGIVSAFIFTVGKLKHLKLALSEIQNDMKLIRVQQEKTH